MSMALDLQEMPSAIFNVGRDASVRVRDSGMALFYECCVNEAGDA